MAAPLTELFKAKVTSSFMVRGKGLLNTIAMILVISLASHITKRLDNFTFEVDFILVTTHLISPLTHRKKNLDYYFTTKPVKKR